MQTKSKKLLPRTYTDAITFIQEEIKVMQEAFTEIRQKCANIESQLIDLPVEPPAVQDYIKTMGGDYEKVLRHLCVRREEVMKKSPEQVRQPLVDVVQARIYSTKLKMKEFIAMINKQKQTFFGDRWPVILQKAIDELKHSFRITLQDFQSKICAIQAVSAELLKSKKLLALEKLIESVGREYKKSVLSEGYMGWHTALETAFSDDRSVIILSKHLDDLENQMQTIRDEKQKAVDTLEDYKRQIRRKIDPFLILPSAQPESQTTVGTIEIINLERSDEMIYQMDRDISHIQHAHDVTLIEVERQKNAINGRLNSVKELEQLIHLLTFRMHETKQMFQDEMTDLQIKRQHLLSRRGTPDSQAETALAELDRTISDRRITEEMALRRLEEQKYEIQRESLSKVKCFGDTLETLQRLQEALLAELETETSNEETNTQLSILKSSFESDSEKFTEYAKSVSKLDFEEVDFEKQPVVDCFKKFVGVIVKKYATNSLR